MSFSQTQLEALQTALTQGERRVSFGDKTVVASGNLRSIVPLTASTGYLGGDNSGVSYYSGTSITSILAGNFRIVEVYGGQLYYSTGSASGGATKGIVKLGTGTPTSAATRTLLFEANSPYGFVIFDTNTDGTPDLAYVCDDSSASATPTATVGGGLKKYTYNGSSWSHAWTLRTALAPSTALAAANSTACAGLTGSYAGGTATLYTTETLSVNNRVLQVIDSGTEPTSATTIATAGANYWFRGVDLKGF